MIKIDRIQAVETATRNCLDCMTRRVIEVEYLEGFNRVLKLILKRAAKRAAARATRIDVGSAVSEAIPTFGTSQTAVIAAQWIRDNVPIFESLSDVLMVRQE